MREKIAPAREVEVKEKMEERTEQEPGEEKWQACWCCRDQQKACRMALAEKLEHIGSAEKERVASVPQREQLASTPEPPLPKKKEQSRQFRAPDRKGRDSLSERAPHLGERGGDQSRSMERKEWTPQ